MNEEYQSSDAVNSRNKNSNFVNVFVTNQSIDSIHSRQAEISIGEFEAAANEVAIEMAKQQPRVYTGKRGRQFNFGFWINMR